MIPESFPEANKVIGKSVDPVTGHGVDIKIFVGNMKGGAIDGSEVFVIAWRPNAQELEELKNGALIYVTCMDGIPEHTLQTSFKDATQV